MVKIAFYCPFLCLPVTPAPSTAGVLRGVSEEVFNIKPFLFTVEQTVNIVAQASDKMPAKGLHMKKLVGLETRISNDDDYFLCPDDGVQLIQKLDMDLVITLA